MGASWRDRTSAWSASVLSRRNDRAWDLATLATVLVLAAGVVGLWRPVVFIGVIAFMACQLRNVAASVHRHRPRRQRVAAE